MDDDIENQLARLFEQAAARLEPPVEELVAAGTVLGRRRRRRRTAGTACAAVGVIGLTAGVVLGVQRLGIGGAPGGGPVAAAGPGRGSGSAAAARPGSARPPTTAGSASAPGASSPAVSAAASGPQTAPALLARLLSGYGLHEVGPRADPIGVADLVFDDGHGRSEIIASVLRYTPDLAGSHAYTCAYFASADAGARPAGAPKPSCTTTYAAGGLTEYLVVTADDGSGFYDYEVNLFAPGGVVVALDAGNGVPHGAAVAVTRAVPPLSLGQMQAVVADPGWLAYRDAS